jgi:outer membrane protein OmpA-like peptidoglycan-associated protein
MGANLIDTVRGLITPEMVDKAAASTGEAPEGIKKALHGALPTIFAALVHRSSTPDGASTVFGMISQSAVSGMVGKLTGSAEALAKSSGITGSSASRILEFVTPLVAGVLGKEVVSGKMDAGQLSQMLSSHKQAIADDPHTPSGISDALGAKPVSGAEPAPSRFREYEQRAREVEQKMERGARDVGLKVERGARDLGQKVERGARDVEQRASKATGGHPWKVVIPALAIGFAVWGLIMANRHHEPRTGVTAVQPSVPTMPTLEAPPAPAVPAAPAFKAPSAGVSLPGGATLDVAPGSAEAQFAHALADDAVLLPRTFSFDNLTFDPATATLGLDASKTLDAVATTLKAYPSSAVRIEGFAGERRSPAANRILGESRARTIKDSLVSQGVAPERIHITGKGAHAATARHTEVVLLHR